MIGPSEISIAALIGAGAFAAVLRLIVWRRAARVAEAGPPWRFPALIALNLMAAAFLYLTLDPPDVGVRTGRLVVLTAGAPANVAKPPGDIVVALPEGPTSTRARVPDLATALRRHPEVGLIQVLGAGLTARDRDAVDRPVAFDPPAAPAGLVALHLPEPVAAGAPFAVGGAIGTLGSGLVELSDPTGAVVDRATVSAGQAFTLRSAARAVGLAVFQLRLTDPEGGLIERIDVPLTVRESAPPRVILMAGAPGPEPRFLRRWAQEVGVNLTVQLALGAGIDLTARPAPLTAATLSRTDLLVIDERRWETLGAAERAAVRTATAGGMGLLLRPTGPLSDATRRDWAALGASLSGGETLRPLALDSQSSPNQGAEPVEDLADVPPELTRRDFAQAGEAAVLVSDVDGVPLATWRPYGSGRVGVWTVADSYALVLTGQADRYGTLWSRMFSQLARPEGVPPPGLEGVARAGDRAEICGISDGDALIGPDGARSRLVLDPRAGPTACAAIWPRTSGWHAVANADGERAVVYVHPSDATPSLIAADMRQAMLDLESEAAVSSGEASTTRAGSPLPWVLAFLLSAAALWWLERRRPPLSPPPVA